MCLTCKELNHCLLPRLYKDLQLSLRSDYAIIRRTETLLESEVVGLRYTKSLTIVNSSDRGEGVLEQGPEVNKAKTVDNVDRFFGRDQDPSLSTSLSLMLNCLIRLLLHRIPKHQLESFK